MLSVKTASINCVTNELSNKQTNQPANNPREVTN